MDLAGDGTAAGLSSQYVYVAVPAAVVLALIGAGTYGHVKRRRRRARGGRDPEGRAGGDSISRD